MTFSSALSLSPRRIGRSTAPMDACPNDVSIVIPVKNNQRGIDRFLTAFLRTHLPKQFPREIILVDNASIPSLTIAPHFIECGLPIVVLQCSQQGPACARNVGAQAACGEWILFTDSDCVPLESFLDGYLSHLTGAVGYAGSVLAAGTDVLSHYYESQAILMPPTLQDNESDRPAYIITANALVWRRAWMQSGGFDESIQIAAGEDVDFGLRLWEIGPLSFASHAQVMHVFEGGLPAFVKRFLRYGRGNHLLRQRTGFDFTPHPFRACIPTLPNTLLASLQYTALWCGYHTPFRSFASSLQSGNGAPHRPRSSIATSALFVDGDQVPPLVIGPLLAEMARRGWEPSIRHVYRKPRLIGTKRPDAWDKVVQQYSLEMIEVDLQKPNAVDMALALGAMNVLHLVSPHFVCIATSDTDFLLLARQVQQAGCQVLGVGATMTSKKLRDAYNDFMTYEQLPSYSLPFH